MQNHLLQATGFSLCPWSHPGSAFDQSVSACALQTSLDFTDLPEFYRPPSYPQRGWFSPYASAPCWFHQPPLPSIICLYGSPCQNFLSFPIAALLPQRHLLGYLARTRHCSNLESCEALLVKQHQDILKKAAVVGKRHSPLWLPEMRAGNHSWREMLLENNLSTDQEVFAMRYLLWQAS